MAKVTSKLQVTVPRKIADQYHIQPCDEIDWVAAGEMIWVIPPGKVAASESRKSRLRWFDRATQGQRKRSAGRAVGRSGDRGWTREDLYGRGRSR